VKPAASALENLHNAGFSHGDCKWSNCLWVADKLYLVDLEAVSKRGKRQHVDLARFTMNAEDLALPAQLFGVFLNHYFDSVEKTREELVPKILPVLKRLRTRHQLQYGSRGHKLLGETQDDGYTSGQHRR